MHRVWIKCRCGHEGWGQTAADVLRLDRAELLRQARCTACGTRGAVEVRRVWDAGANAMAGAGRRWNDGGGGMTVAGYMQK